MSFSWQNLRDDLYAYKWRYLHRSGYVFLPLGFLCFAAPVVIKPETSMVPLASTLLLFGCVLIGLSVSFLTHPSMIGEETRYQYHVDVDQVDVEKLKHFLTNSEFDWSTRNYPNPLKFSNRIISTRIFLTRLEDRILLRMRF